ncbi:helix-turn-helix transcriptional regulator [Paenibacillus agricola]|uniref:Helix-turn-helix transcriptional regulator n=1 Tax=Paenibacillus agricola TaxID=2716264 RepID=A0ABX0JGW1_9BACL|nr:helix-turn-helix transcriptional regulator [Paenibacillus agricola]NHN33504.1 helix-turn-helix transcriptional regulator [Paenibacillus agricola]
MADRRQQLIACRESKGSREEVALELGISKVYLRMIETGALKPGRDVMFRISSYCGQPLEILFPDLFSDERVV